MVDLRVHNIKVIRRVLTRLNVNCISQEPPEFPLSCLHQLYMQHLLACIYIHTSVMCIYRKSQYRKGHCCISKAPQCINNFLKMSEILYIYTLKFLHLDCISTQTLLLDEFDVTFNAILIIQLWLCNTRIFLFHFDCFAIFCLRE